MNIEFRIGNAFGDGGSGPDIEHDIVDSVFVLESHNIIMFLVCGDGDL